MRNQPEASTVYLGPGSPPPRRLRVLQSAYACEPGRGSESDVGWGLAQEMSKYHDVWVLTRANNRPAIEKALGGAPTMGLRFVYYDLPGWARWWKRRQRGVQLYYYLWQIAAYFVVRRLHRRVGFDLSHHVTFVKHWAPSFLAMLDIPFIWGPVGGGDSTPKAFVRDMTLRGRSYEILRGIGRWLGEHDPFVRLTARCSMIAFAATNATAQCLRKLGARDIRLLSQVGLSTSEIRRLSQPALPETGPIRFVSIGRLLALKGFHLGLRSFARARLDHCEYWIVGDGPELGRLKALACRLGIIGQVRFWGRLSRNETLDRIRESHVLVHPSLHDSGGWVCAEAMAIGRPVICLDVGGPAVQVTDRTGFRISPSTPPQTVQDLAEAMQRLASEPNLRRKMGEAGRLQCEEMLCWESKGKMLEAAYRLVAQQRGGPALLAEGIARHTSVPGHRIQT
jgi:glycosyltransferase involved in cell wall biosynthesis